MTLRVIWAASVRVQQLPESIGAPLDGSSGLGAADWAVAVLVLVSGLAAASIARRAIVSLLRRGTTIESMAEQLIGRTVQIVIVLVALSYALSVLGVRIGPLLGALGIGGIAVALALQETLKDLFAGVILHAQRPLKVGEEIVTGETQGTVLDVTSRAVTIQSNSGRTVYVPNSLVLDREIVNLVRHGSRRTTTVVGVAYGTDLGRAQEVIRAAAAGAEGVLDDPPVRVLCVELADSSVNFEIDYWHGPVESMRREANSSVVMAVYRSLGDAGITIPFPQRTVWSGEPVAKAEETEAVDAD